MIVFEPREHPDARPERCEGCGNFGVFGTDEAGRPVWLEICCPCALLELERGCPRQRWCYEVPHTTERCRQVRAARPLPQLEIEPA